MNSENMDLGHVLAGPPSAPPTRQPEPPQPGIPPEPCPVAPRYTLGDLLRMLSASDEGLAADFDPAAVVGSLREKVDSIKVIMDRLKFQATWAEQQAKPFAMAAKALKNNRERLKEYVLFKMKSEKFSSLPGVKWQINLSDNQPALDILKHEADALDFQKYPAYCKQIRRYEWDHEAIREALIGIREREAQAKPDLLKESTFAWPLIPFARLTIGKQFRFAMNKPEALPPKEKKPRAKRTSP